MGARNNISIEITPKKILVISILALLTVSVSYSYVVALMAFVAPSSSFPLDIIETDTFDESNTTQSSFSRGVLVKINCTIEMGLSYVNFPWSYDYFNFVDDSSYRVIVTVMDSQKMPVFINFMQKTISIGEDQISIFEYNIASNAATGTYTANILVWSDWLPSGKSLTPQGDEVTFSVT